MIWTKNDDSILLGMHRKSFTTPQLAARFGATEQEVLARLLHLEQESSVDGRVAADGVPPKTAAPEEAASEIPEEQPMDALQMVFLDFCRSYELLGEQLKFFGEFVSRSQSAEQILIEATSIEQFRSTCLGKVLPANLFLGKVLPANLFLAQKLHERYILIPRPAIVPREPVAKVEEPK